jgi:lysophospholipase L1-like esterase
MEEPQSPDRVAGGRRPEPTVRKKILFTALAVGCLCVAIEGFARVVWWRLERESLKTHYQKGEAILNNDAINYMKVADGIYGYQLKPGFRNENNSINSAGFHQKNDIAVDRPLGSLRIVCLGESTTFGSTDLVNYPALLGRILDADADGYRRYEVINAGVPGWMSDQIALRVQHQIVRFAPDVVVLYVGWNDFQSYAPRFPVASESTFALSFGRTPWRHYASNWSRAVALLSALDERRREPSAADYAEVLAHANPPDQRYRFLLTNLADIVQSLKSSKAATRIFICTLVGLWPQGSDEAWAKMQSPWWVQHHKYTHAQTAHVVDELNDQLRRFARDHGATLIDTAAIFEPLDRTRLQWDFAHMYADGYELIAWSIFDALRESGLITARRGDNRHSELLSTYRLTSGVAAGGR